jgi:nondiscriminating glutamyl-tRNA synthetase
MNEMTEPRLRFAPSPTGMLHVGNARTALFNWLLARAGGGQFILRLEDTDTERSTDRSAEAIIDDLRWLGLDWDEGPERGGDCGPYRQSERQDLYRQEAQRLLDAGRAYHCFCRPEDLERARQEAQQQGQPQRYPGTCRHIPREEAEKRMAAGEPAALRFRMPDGELVVRDLVRGEVRFDCAEFGDLVILRADGSAAYNFAVVVDDAGMRISHVVRGEDHLTNTPKQIQLFRALGYDNLPQYAHLPMILGPDRSRLSKRHGVTSVGQFREEGILAPALVNYLALLGWSPGSGEEEILDTGELVRRFALDRVNKSAAVFDPVKLAWVNGKHWRALDAAGRLEAALPFLCRAEWCPAAPESAELAWFSAAVEAFAPKVERLDSLPELFRVFFHFDPRAAAADPEALSALGSPTARPVLEALDRELRDGGAAAEGGLAALFKRVQKETGVKGKDFYHPLRAALTGSMSGLELGSLIPLLEQGKELDGFAVPIPGVGERIGKVLDSGGI